MSVNKTRQCNPVSTLETSTDDGLSVRAMNDLADTANNAHRYVFAFPLIVQPIIPRYASPDNDDETLGLYLGRFEIPYSRDGMSESSYARWWVHMERFQGSGETTWTLYASRDLYLGDATFDANELSSDVASSQIVTDTDDIRAATNFIKLPAADPQGWMFFYLTSENDAGSPRTRSYLYDISIQPYYL